MSNSNTNIDTTQNLQVPTSQDTNVTDSNIPQNIHVSDSNTPQNTNLSGSNTPQNANALANNTSQNLLQSLQDTFFHRLRTFINNTEPSVSWIVGAISLIGGTLFIISYMDTKVNQAILDKFAPYENLQVGMSQVQNYEYDNAIPDLEIAFKKLGVRFADEQVKSRTYSLIMDHYLYAIVNSRVPYEHELRFKEILKLESENKTSFGAWHYHHFGWYYFRTGDLNKAEHNFRRAIELYKLEESLVESADSYWALTLIDLCKGNLDSAEKNYKEAYKLKNDFAPESVFRTIQTMDKGYFYKPILNSYDINKYLPEFLKRLQKVKPLGSLIRGSDVDGYGNGFHK